jgi:hypothetical protein
MAAPKTANHFLSIDEIEADRKVKLWFKKKELKAKTKISYLHAMQQFCDLWEMTPSELFREAKTDVKDPDLWVNEYCHIEKIIEFKDHLNNFKIGVKGGKGYARQTIKTKMNAVVEFYRKNGIEIGKDERYVKDGTLVQPQNRKIPDEEVMSDVTACKLDEFEEAFILGQSSSGLANADMSNITIRQFKEGFRPETGVTLLHVTRVKTGVEFRTFFSIEATDSINRYIQKRQLKPDSYNRCVLTGHEKQKITSDDNYLFCQRSIAKQYLEPESEYMEKHAKYAEAQDKFEKAMAHGDIEAMQQHKLVMEEWRKYKYETQEDIRKLTNAVIMKMYRKIATKSGHGGEKWEWDDVRGHKVRAFFGNSLLNFTNSKDKVKYLMGHKQSVVDDAYFKYTDEVLEDFYVSQCLPRLHFSDTKVYELDAPAKKRLLEENEALKAKVEAQDAQNAEMSERLSKLEILAEMQQRSMQSVNETIDKNMKAKMQDEDDRSEYYEALADNPE